VYVFIVLESSHTSLIIIILFLFLFFSFLHQAGDGTSLASKKFAHSTSRGDSADVRGSNVRLMAMKFGGVKSDQRSALSGK
jgi:hypothetical protein